MFSQYDEISPLPKEYLKLKYSDFPLGIVWEDTITFSYDFIEKNTFATNTDLKVFDDVGSLRGSNIMPIQTPASFANYINHLNGVDVKGPATNKILKYGPY